MNNKIALVALCCESWLICHHLDPWQLFIDALGPDDKMMNRAEVIRSTLEMHHRYALSTGSATAPYNNWLPDDFINSIIPIKMYLSRKKNTSYWPGFACCLLLMKFEINIYMCATLKTMWGKKKTVYFHLANRYLCYFLFSHLLSWGLMQLWFTWGYWCPRLNTLRLCSAASLLSFAQLKRIKVCFFPKHNYRVWNES